MYRQSTHGYGYYSRHDSVGKALKVSQILNLILAAALIVLLIVLFTGGRSASSGKTILGMKEELTSAVEASNRLSRSGSTMTNITLMEVYGHVRGAQVLNDMYASSHSTREFISLSLFNTVYQTIEEFSNELSKGNSTLAAQTTLGNELAALQAALALKE